MTLYTEKEIGSEFKLVSEGPVILGGDPMLADTSLTRSEIELDSFLIASQPVMLCEYLEFLNELAATDGIDAALARSPRQTADSGQYAERAADGGLRFPDVDAEGDVWHPRMPVFGISWHDADAYCQWYSRTRGRVVRLPTEQEWEKAARGVDGRLFPWGSRFDSSLCNIVGSRSSRPAPVTVDEFPTDVSVYGARGMAGNIREWTATPIDEGTGDQKRKTLVFRGGGWGSPTLQARICARGWSESFAVTAIRGFRLAADPRRMP